MEKLHKEPGDYTKDSSSFTLELQKFHESRGSPFRHAPRINGREVDLFALYNSVTAIGGWQKVNDLLKWDYVLDKLNFPKACANASLALRQIYVRYLSVFEKVHFLGEDADEEVDPGSESRGGRKSTGSALVQVPMSYNRAQHEIPESQRLAVGLAPSLGGPSEYNKLCLSLLSGLPNEEALSLNVCTLLSNEGRHSLKLDRNPRLLDLLLAQAGLFTPDDATLRPTLLECWQGVEGRRMERFWEDNLDPETIALFNIGNGCKDEEDELFNLNYEVGTRSIEGQRVLRIALIFHNLSFEERNAVVLARNRTFIRFVMLSALSRWSTLRQVALDTIGNLASKLVLYPAPEEDEEEASLGRCYEDLAGDRQRWSCALLRLTREGVQSQDRYLVVRCLDILARLCRQERNAEPLLAALDGALCRRVFELLTVHDLMLLIYALEALYMLSELGRDACERMLHVHRSMGILVSLLTLDPLAYGPLAQKGMKLIETVDPLLPPPVPVNNPAAPTPMAAPPPPPPPVVGLAVPQSTATTTNLGAVPAGVPGAVPTPTGGAVTTAPPPQTDPFDTEAFAGTWVRAMYEPAPPGCSVARNDIYAEYVTFCSKAGRKSVISASVFANCVKTVYTQTGIRRVDSANGMVSFHHDGLRKRLNPLPVPIQVTSCLSISTQAAATTLRSPLATGSGTTAASSHSPILKAQLSAPLRALTPPANQVSPPPSPALATPVAASTTPPGAGAAGGGSSNLIKSLLANKVSRNLQRQQQMQQQQTTATAASADADATPVTAGTPVLANSATAPRAVPEPVRREVNPASPAINSHHHHHHHHQAASTTVVQPFTFSSSASAATVSTVTATAASPQVSCLTSALQAKLQSQVQAQPAAVHVRMQSQVQVQVPTIHQAQIQVQVPTAAAQSQSAQVAATTVQAQRQVQGLPTTATTQALPTAAVHLQQQQQQQQVQVPAVQAQTQVQVQVPTMAAAQSQQVQVQVQPQQVQVQVPTGTIQPQQVQVQVPGAVVQPQQVQVQVAGSGLQTQFQPQQVQVQASPVVQAQVQPQVQVQVPTQICQAALQTGPMLLQSAQPGTVVQAPTQVVVSMAPSVSISMPPVSFQTSMPVQAPLQVTFPTTVSTPLSASTQSLVSSLASSMTSSLAAGLAANQTVVVSSSALASSLASSLNSGSNQTVVMGSNLGGNPTVMMGSGLASNPVVAQGTSLAASLASAGGLPPGATIVMVPNSATGITTGMLVVRPQGKLPAGAVNAALLARSQAVANAINAGARGPLIVSTRPNGFQRDFVMEVSMPADCKSTSLEAAVQQAIATTTTAAEQHPAHNHIGENGTASPVVVTTTATATTHKCGGTVVHPTTAVVSEVAVEGAKSVEGGVVYKSSPLLNGLLDKGKVPLAMEPTGLQNGSAEEELQQCADANAEQGGEGVSVVVSNGPCTVAKVAATPDLSPIKDIVGSVESASKVISRSNVDVAAGAKRPAADAADDSGASCAKRLRLEDSCETTFQAEAVPATTVPSSGSQTAVVVTRAAELPSVTTHQHVLVHHGVIQQGVTTTTTGQQSTTPVTVQHTCAHQTVLQRGPQAPVTTAPPVAEQPTVTTAAPTVPQPNLVKLLSTTDSGKIVTAASASPVTTAASVVSTAAAPSATPTSTQSAEVKVAPTASKTVGAADGEKKAAAAAASAAAHHHHHHHHHHHKAAKLVYNCEWKGCEKTFSTPSAVFYHACNVHIPEAEGDVQCQWDSCDDMKRRRLSLFTHLQDRHCNEQVLQIQAVRRQQISQFGKASLPPPAQPPPHPGYAPDAAFLAIRRHALAYYNHRDASDEKESALARSIRLTSALIIRNLATHSSLARRYLRRYEQQLSTVAMSPLELSRTIAQCLREMARVSTPD
ncbi:brahma associated protein 170kD [Haemaphysalis longicornis]